MPTCDSREKPQTAPPHDVARNGGRFWSAGVPANGNLPRDQRVGVSALVRGPAPHAYQRAAARCGRQRILELPATQSRQYRGSQTGSDDGSFLLNSPYLVSWIGPVLKILTGGHRDGHLFEFNYTDFLEQFRGLDDAASKETLRASLDLNNNCRSLQEAQKRGKWRQHLSTARFEKHTRPQATASRYSRASLQFLKVARGCFVDAIWNRAKIDLCSPFEPRAGTRSSCFLVEMVRDVQCRLMGFAARSWELDTCLASQADTRRWLATFVLRSDSWKCSVCLHHCSVFEPAQFAQVHGNDFENSPCL